MQKLTKLNQNLRESRSTIQDTVRRLYGETYNTSLSDNINIDYRDKVSQKKYGGSSGCCFTCMVEGAPSMCSAFYISSDISQHNYGIYGSGNRYFAKVKVARVQGSGSTFINEDAVGLKEIQVWINNNNVAHNSYGSIASLNPERTGDDVTPSLLKASNLIDGTIGTDSDGRGFAASASDAYLLVHLGHVYHLDTLQSVVLYNQGFGSDRIKGCRILLLDFNDNVLFESPVITDTFDYYRIDGKSPVPSYSSSASTSFIINNTY